MRKKEILLAIGISVLLAFNLYAQGNSLIAVGGEGKPGSTGNVVSIVLKNTAAVGGVQFTLTDVPNVLTATGGSGVGRAAAPNFTTSISDNGTAVTVLVFSMTGATMAPDSSVILEILYNVDAGASPGTVSLEFSGVILSDAVGQSLPVTPVNGSFTIPTTQVVFTTVVNHGITTTVGAMGFAWGDYDGDGDLDVFIGGAGSPSVLYSNNGDGTFTSVAYTPEDPSTYTLGSIWADFDGDADLDLLMTQGSGLSLYQNDGGGAFTDITVASGLNAVAQVANALIASAGDYDRDGDLDLALAGSYADNSAVPVCLLQNNGGVFTDVAATALDVSKKFEAWNPAWVDYNNDGWMDLFMPTLRNGLPNDCGLFLNKGDGTFADGSGSLWNTKSAIASAWGDYDNDGDMDLVTSSLAADGFKVRLFKNNGNATFDTVQTAAGLVYNGNARGLSWGDFDNDCYLDLLVGVSGGNLELWHNNGNGTFTNGGGSSGVTSIAGGNRSALLVDYDNDGFLDIYLNGFNSAKTLLHNEKNSNHWVGIKLADALAASKNRSAIGARIILYADGKVQSRDIQAGGCGGMTSGNIWANFGLGSATTIDSVVIRWPDGKVDVKTNVAIDTYQTIERTGPPPTFIVVDGQKDAFYNTLTGPNDGYLQIKFYASNDNGSPVNDADLSAKVWTAWDDKWFYLYEEVMDDTIAGNATNSYENDCLELKFDPQATDSVTNSVWDVRLNILGKADGAVSSDSLNNVADSLKQWVRKVIPGGYALEMAIKWSAIGHYNPETNESITPAVDNVFGMAIMNHDNDGKARRQASIEWAAVMLDAVWNTPKYHGTVKFLADNKLQFIPKNNMTGKTNPIPYDGTPFYLAIDGKKDGFYNSLTGPNNGYLQIKSYAFNDNGIPTGDADLSAKVWTAWDDKWFYLYEEVKDDTLAGNATNVWEEDCLELKFDPQPTDSVLNSVWDTRLTALGKATAGVVAADSLNNVADSLKQWARTKISGGYALEMAIKWSAIKSGTETITPAVDNVFGMAINNHDNDGKARRQASIMWAAVMLDAVWNTPKYHGTVKFLPDNKLQFIPKNNMTGRTNPTPYDGTPFYMRIDGKKDPFYYSLTKPDNGYLQIRSYAWNDNGVPVDDADLSAKVWAAWDDEWFYLYEEVKDDTLSGNATNVWEEDEIELKFDPQPTDSTQGGTSVWDTRFTALSKRERGVVAADSLNNVPDPLKQWVRTKITGGYALEMAFKWSAVKSSNGETITPAVNNVFGMAINQHDNDGKARRQASIMWAAVMKDAVWNTPKYHGTVKFLANNKLQFIPKNNMTGVTNPIPYDGRDYSRPVGVEDIVSSVPLTYSLQQNYPNPFNPATTISYSIASTSDVRLTVYDVLGREVVTLVDERKQPGIYSATFDGRDLASGIYFYRLEAGSYVKTQKMIMIK